MAGPSGSVIAILYREIAMEQYLVLLFLLFSVVSALLERRKRARQLEEAKQAREKRLEREKEQGGPLASEPELEEAEKEEVWPFPMGSEPVEPRPARRRRPSLAEVEEGEEEALPSPTGGGRSLMELLEDQMRGAEERTRRREEQLRQQQEQAREAAAQARRQARQVQSPKPLAELVTQRVARDQPRRRGARWSLDPRRAREAIVLAEILGRPLGERQDAFGGGGGAQ